MELFTILLATTTLVAAESPFACNLAAMTPAVRKHHFEEVTPALRKLVKRIHETPDGFAFELPADPATIHLTSDWLANEQLCCPFLDITLRLERERGGLWLQLGGRAGAKDFIRAEFGSWLVTPQPPK